MTFALAILLSALAISNSDRMAMADRLFNRGDYAQAKKEYLALESEVGLDRAAILYRLVAAGKAMKEAAFVREKGAQFLQEFPGHEKENHVRFLRALMGTDEEKLHELKELDRDGVPNDIRAGALCIMGTQLNDESMLERSVKLDPSGSYTSYAKSTRATKLMKSADPADHRRAVELFLELVYGPDKQLAKEALYAATYITYNDGRYQDAERLATRFINAYPHDSRQKAVRNMLAMSEYRLGRYIAALEQCTDDHDEWQLLVRASVQERLGHRAEARAAAEQALNEFPNGECRSMLKMILARLEFADASSTDDVEATLMAARKTVELTQTPADRIRLAWALEKAGKRDEAEVEYGNIARDYPNTETAADALYRRAMSLLRRQQWSLADIALDEALATGKLAGERIASAQYWRGIAASRLGHMQEAVALLKKAMEGSISLDERREARLVIADFDFNEGRREDAIAEYRELIKEGAVVRMSAAKTLAVGKLLSGDEARICANALTKNEAPEWRQAGYALLGDLEMAEENLTAAAYAYQKCMDEPCTTEVIPHVSLVLGQHLVREGNAAEAEKVLKRAVELNAKDNEARAAAYLGLAEAALLKDDLETAQGYATVVTTLFETTASAAKAKEILK